MKQVSEKQVLINRDRSFFIHQGQFIFFFISITDAWCSTWQPCTLHRSYHWPSEHLYCVSILFSWKPSSKFDFIIILWCHLQSSACWFGAGASRIKQWTLGINELTYLTEPCRGYGLFPEEWYFGAPPPPPPPHHHHHRRRRRRHRHRYHYQYNYLYCCLFIRWCSWSWCFLILRVCLMAPFDIRLLTLLLIIYTFFYTWQTLN